MGADIPDFGDMALCEAIRKGWEHAVQALVDLGVTLMAYKRCCGQHPLVTASSAGHAGIVRMLIESGTYTTTPDTMGASLLSACGGGHDSVVRVLLDNGALVNIQDSQRTTPLIRTCNHGHLSIVNMLLESGADVNLGSREDTPLTAACKLGEPSIVQALLAAGAEPNPVVVQSPLSLVFDRIGMMLNVLNVSKYEAIARLLLDDSADPNAKRDKHYSRSLMYAASVCGKAELLMLLFEKGADASIGGGFDYYEALLDSCCNGHEEVVKVLLANGASVVCRNDEYYRRVVEEATRNRQGRTVELVLTEGHGFRAQRRDLYGGSLQIALNQGYDEIATILMDTGVELPEQLDFGDTPGATLSLWRYE